MDFSTASFDLIKHDLNNARTINSDQVLYNRIKEAGDSKAQLQKAAEEFEAIFVTKMLTEMDKTVDRENGLFGDKNQYQDTFKSIIYDSEENELSQRMLISKTKGNVKLDSNNIDIDLNAITGGL